MPSRVDEVDEAADERVVLRRWREMSGAVRFELVGPSEASWVLGDTDAATVISGPASTCSGSRHDG